MLEMSNIQSRPLYNSEGVRFPFFQGPYLVTQVDDKGKSFSSTSDTSVFRPSQAQNLSDMLSFSTHTRAYRKTKWYGKSSDGFIACTSVIMYETLGFKYYEPLPPAGVGGGSKTPDWLKDFYSLPNIALPMSYFCVGIALQLLRTPLIVYFIEDKNASPAEVNVLFTVMAVPWCFKVIYGFMSDCLPIMGERRKPYLIIGWVGYMVSNVILALAGDPSIEFCVLMVFVMTSFYMLADVMTDALIVERSRFEEKRGVMQGQGYIIRFFGSTIGAAIGAVVYNKADWEHYMPISTIFLLNGLFVVVFIFPFIPYMVELADECQPKSFMDQCGDLFKTVQLRAVWQPMSFIYIFNAMQIANAAWMSFLVEGLGFRAWEIGILGVVASLMTWFGIVSYKKYFFDSSWRIVFVVCSSINVFIGLLQLCLTTGKNREWGIPDLVFALGDDGVQEFLIGIQFLPMCIMYLGLCPVGAEGTTYAMLTTFSNLAGTVAFDISTALTAVWDVDEETLEKGDFQGIFKLSLLCTLVAPLPLVLINLIPKNQIAQQELLKDKKPTYWAGATFLFVMIATMLATFGESIYVVMFEGGGGENDDYSWSDNVYGSGIGAARQLSRISVT